MLTLIITGLSAVAKWIGGGVSLKLHRRRRRTPAWAVKSRPTKLRSMKYEYDHVLNLGNLDLTSTNDVGILLWYYLLSNKSWDKLIRYYNTWCMSHDHLQCGDWEIKQRKHCKVYNMNMSRVQFHCELWMHINIGRLKTAECRLLIVH